MSGQGKPNNKLMKFINSNLLMIVCVPLIISIHYGWMLLQKNPKLVPEKDYQELPIIIVSIQRIVFNCLLISINFDLLVMLNYNCRRQLNIWRRKPKKKLEN